MIKIKVLNHLNKFVIIEVDESVHTEICKILQITADDLKNHYELITEKVVNDAVNNTIKKP